MLKKQTLMGAFAFMIMGFTAVATPMAYAQTTNAAPVHENFFQGLVQFISQKFGLNQDQVKAAVTDYSNQQKATMQQNMQNREKSRLDALVKSGKITADQEQAIITEMAALQAKYNPANMKNLTPAQRKQQMQDRQSDLKTWATQQGIDLSILMPPMGAGMGKGRGGGFRGGWKPSASPSATP